MWKNFVESFKSMWQVPDYFKDQRISMLEDMIRYLHVQNEKLQRENLILKETARETSSASN